MDASAQQLLDEWFSETRRDPALAPERNGYWFGPDPGRDRRLEQRFGGLVESGLNGGLIDWQDEPESRLALILLLDQLPRNIYRGKARAFAGDARAAALSLAGIGTGMELSLTPVEQAFFYMPLQHAEDRATQRLGVQQFRNLAERNPEYGGVFENFLRHAEEHRDIIEKFGRFPHRNPILGRESTTQELQFLERGAKRYGQTSSRG